MKRKVYLLVTIDTECDKDLNWEIPQPMSFMNIELQNQLLAPIFERNDIRPTYLLSPEVLLNEKSVNNLKKIKNASFGTHLHEEFLPPNEKKIVTRTYNIQANLTYDQEYLKLKNLTDLFHERFHYYPKSFRSGRFGSSKHTCEILTKLGYKVDSSITPFKTLYFDNDIKIKTWHLGLEPYFVKFKENNKSYLLEVPLTLINRDFERLPKFVLRHLENKPTFLKKILKRFGYKSRTEWLRPYRVDANGLISISDHVISNHFKDKEFAILNIMFHSNEILKNASPYCKTEEEVMLFIDSLDKLFIYLSKNYNLCSIGLEEVYDLYH